MPTKYATNLTGGSLITSEWHETNYLEQYLFIVMLSDHESPSQPFYTNLKSSGTYIFWWIIYFRSLLKGKLDRKLI